MAVLTSTENQVVRKTPQVVQVKREPWDIIRAQRTIVPFVISITVTQIAILISLFSLSLLIGLISNISGQIGIEIGLISSIAILVVLIDIIYALLSYLFWKSVIYELKSHTFEIIREFVDARSGKITIYSGVFIKRMKIYQIAEYNNVSVIKGLFGNFFNFGTILVSSADKTKRIRLRAVKSPNDFARVIQGMIDTTTSALQYVDSGLIEKEDSKTKTETVEKMYEGNDYVS